MSGVQTAGVTPVLAWAVAEVSVLPEPLRSPEISASGHPETMVPGDQETRLQIMNYEYNSNSASL